MIFTRYYFNNFCTLVGRDLAYIDKSSKMQKYTPLYNIYDNYPKYNVGKELGVTIEALKLKGCRKAPLKSFYDLTSKVKGAQTKILHKNYYPFKEQVENNDIREDDNSLIKYSNETIIDSNLEINDPDVVIGDQDQVVQDPHVMIEDPHVMIEEPDVVIEEPDAVLEEDLDTVTEHEGFDEEDQNFKEYLHSCLEDEIHVTNIHRFMHETECFARKYRQNNNYFWKFIVTLRLKLKKIMYIIIHFLLKYLTFRKYRPYMY
ncbi:Plasmodium exported protein, unknown function [Plasmodium gonderi]|uniref:Uncharacterized protein n=1 Tax=Plasmodium gonderi TaxID=77519 RepID=A0A1Y1JRX8_PLAGO|nr:Plasmodium exported protein, unknown function [Plasmodium gonderi]GAW83223.1 Plasmodium exported protein, unknown function [Plasmodium gonderi]